MTGRLMALGLIAGLAAPGAAAPVARPCAAPPGSACPPAALVPAPPRGYVAVWTDGRINPQRGDRTEAGQAAMAQVWTDTVPMRLRAGD